MPSIFESDAELDRLAATAFERTKALMKESDKLRDRREKANRKRVARLFKDPEAIEATITLTDEVMRISSVKSSSRIFRRAAKKASITDDVNEKYSRVRWLASSKPPIFGEMQKGISVDHRPIAQRGDIETPRWLIEQSVAIIYHRYGNPNGGPKPKCDGLSA